ncbi:L-threonylcarbamoyladenylate synthase [Cytophagaceae bacterium ABcell3]|nr:L-threonylcarbamoyladenylate synthase [Cytophagaceae bacterium ABcell3]
MKGKLIKINPDNPQENKIREVAEILSKGGVVIYPTDTVYGIGCDIFNKKAVERICKIKNMNPAKSHFSFICHDLSHIADYAKIPDQVYKVMKKALPGPFTFILNANKTVPKVLNPKKSTVGIRVPDNNIPRMLVKELGNPIITTSIRDEDDILEYSTDPELIYEKFKDTVDAVIDGGYGNNMASTVVDCTNEEFEVVREGLGNLEQYI